HDPQDTAHVGPIGLVREALADIHSDHDGRCVDFTRTELPPCHDDPALLKQVILNLLTNAFKFTAERDVARIAVGWCEQDGRPVYFVRDNGVGFDMRYAHKLFGVFQRLHRAEDYERTRVGLAIVPRIIPRHGRRTLPRAASARR